MKENINELKGLFTQYWYYLAVYTACKQGIFDAINNKSLSIKTLATSEKLNHDVLQQLVNVLIQQDLIIMDDEILRLTAKGKILTEDHPYSLKYACLNWGAEHLTSWQNLDYSLKSGKQAFNRIYKMPFFEYISKDKEKLSNYHKAMNEYARDDYEQIFEVHDFTEHQSIMDIGGGIGALIDTIQNNAPNTQCYLFDRPEVIDLYKGEVKTIKGNFFNPIPKKADAIIVSRVLHDWCDEKSKLILENIFESLPTNGVIYIVENLTDKIDNNAAILSLNMYAITGGFERNISEYKALLEATGFKYEQIKRVNNLQYLIIAKK